MSKLLGDIGTKYGLPNINIQDLLEEIIYLFEYEEYRDEEFYKYSSKIEYDNTKIKYIHSFYKELSKLNTSLKNKKIILNKYFENIYYHKVNNIFNELKDNPILLEKYDINFITIDKISLENKWWTYESDIRHKMYILFILENICTYKGHVYLDLDHIDKEINVEKYHLNKNKFFEILQSNKEFRKQNGISVSNGGKISLKKYKIAEELLETNIDKLKDIKYEFNNLTNDDFEKFYDGNSELSKEQLKSINSILKYNIVGVIGKGGSGKTSWVINKLCEYLIDIDKNENIIFLAPTHAAKKKGHMELINLSDNISFDTIHSVISKYLVHDTEEVTSKLNESLNKGVKYIIIDEMSMVDLVTFSKFLDICINYDNLHIVLLGDNNQLLPIGVGCPFRDLISCNKIVKTKLTKNFRTQGDIGGFCDTILDNSTRWTLDQGKENSLTKIYNNDISFNFTNNNNETDNELKKLLNNLKSEGYMPYNLDKNNPKTYQIITQKNDDCINYSKFTRNLYNKKKSQKKYEIKDPIIICNNNYSAKNIFNGDDGIIIGKINKFEYLVKLEDNREVVLSDYDFKPALCRTVHSSQGLQFNNVIYICKNNYYLNSNINYTAYSRGKTKLYLIGNINCFDSEKVKQQSEKRNTFISYNYEQTILPQPEII